MTLVQKKSRGLKDYKKLVDSYDNPKSLSLKEKKYWKFIKKRTPLYGSDVLGSLY